MADMYCQNKECCYKKNSNQIRGSKGNKHYQSNKANSYMEYWCTNGCRDQWFKDNATTCMTAVGIIPKQTLPLVNHCINKQMFLIILHLAFSYVFF